MLCQGCKGTRREEGSSAPHLTVGVRLSFISPARGVIFTGAGFPNPDTRAVIVQVTYCLGHGQKWGRGAGGETPAAMGPPSLQPPKKREDFWEEKNPNKLAEELLQNT